MVRIIDVLEDKLYNEQNKIYYSKGIRETEGIMDKGRSFRILGLNETATKAQVKRAYGKMIARYKGPDYAEEPEYVERKLLMLHQAYQEAYDLAESGPDTYERTRPSRIEWDADEPEQRRTARPKERASGSREDDEHNAREKFHQWLEHRDDAKQERRNRRHGGETATPKKKKPELKMPDLKKLDLSKLKDKINEVLPDNEHFQDAEEPEPLVLEMENDGDPKRHIAEKTNSKNDEKIGSIISIVVALVIFLIGSCGDDSTDTSYEEPAFSYIYDMALEDIADEDKDIADLADQSFMLLTEQIEHGSATIGDENESYYRDKADLFAQNYWDKDSISLVSDYLYQNYGEYTTSSDEPVSTQLDAIFAFYGFASLDSASWYDQPYTGERIKSYGDYLDYLNQFYDAQ